MANAVPSPALDFDRHLRRAVWVLAGVIAVAAAIVYSGKAALERSAFIRWRPQVLAFWNGENIYQTRYFPNPPIFPISLTPFMALPPVPGAMAWFALKVAMTAASVLLCFRIVKPAGKPLPSWFQAGVLVFALRPFMGDLHHANNNLVILFLIVTALEAWRRGHDVLAGMLLGLSISYKVTPALFVVYFMLKGSWRIVGTTMLGLGVFLLILPAMIIGPEFNGECLGTWWNHMLSPFLLEGASSPQEMNQSMVGVLTRLLSATPTGEGRYDLHRAVNLVSLSPWAVRLIVKGISLGFLVALALICRTKAERRTDPRLLGEFALVVLTMLFLSERSWKHHFVTLLLPYTYLMAQFAFGGLRTRARVGLALSMWGSVILMATTSNELGGQFLHHQGHKIAQAYGMFLWAGVVLYVATAWRVVAERRRIEEPTHEPATTHYLPTPHYAGRLRTPRA